MRRRSDIERRVRILEGRFATLDTSITGDFALADAHTEAELAVEFSQRVLKTLFCGSTALLVAPILFGALKGLLT